jgi:hypothetical protein
MVETRIAPRYRVMKAGTIEFVGGKPINCVVRDLSVTGAALEVPNRAGIPEKFLLVMPDDDLRLTHLRLNFAATSAHLVKIPLDPLLAVFEGFPRWATFAANGD